MHTALGVFSYKISVSLDIQFANQIYDLGEDAGKRRRRLLVGELKNILKPVVRVKN